MKKQNKFDMFFLLTWKKFFIVAIIFFLAIFLHNVIYGIFKSYFDSVNGDEAFFFILALILIPVYLVVAVIYTLIKKLRNKK